MAEPMGVIWPVVSIADRLGWTKILMPLLQPGVALKSAVNSKLEKRSRVMMSPPAWASALPLETTLNSPPWIVQLLSGKKSPRALRQPAVRGA